ncbi:rab GTPase-activating protein 22 isoform X3 [Cryptomeria japonica]|uniref:rab GTPase-activating protein 22 isoform X3 n=1 Tax=Cryptomeria japonica TaxID=3369 RepID=UPI0025AC9CF1|nr:rab GTPase-activating protein 22 isoform X3 [Cryptomeria japonica]
MFISQCGCKAGHAISLVMPNRGSFRSHWAHKRKRHPLSRQQWSTAFLPDGRLADGGLKVLKQVRSGGIDSSIRAEVWPFLLGVYSLNSSKEERDLERNHKREEYEQLRIQCQCLPNEEISEMISEVINCSTEAQEFGSQEADAFSHSVKDTGMTSEPIFREVDSQDEEDSKLLESSPGNSLQVKYDTSSDNESITEDDLNSNKFSDSHKNGNGKTEAFSDIESSVEDNSNLDDFSAMVKDRHQEKNTSADIEYKVDRIEWLKKTRPKALEDFSTWQRIIRLDAVRMNAEWVPYSSSQANVTEEEASRLASLVGLKNDEHLEPCQKHHAARLVAILETYALYDPEIGYCQGMSDLLSPFVALTDEDYEAFWCFVHFMHVARDNFRLDEVGIRKQLNMVARIIKAKDPHLYKHLEKLEAQDFFFVYRMVVVLFRRELTFEQTLCLWEVIWANQAAVRAGIKKSAWRKGKRRAPPSNDLLLYAIAASVLQKRNLIIEKHTGMDDILRECNSMAGHLDVWKLLDEAHDLVAALHDKI